MFQVSFGRCVPTTHLARGMCLLAVFAGMLITSSLVAVMSRAGNPSTFTRYSMQHFAERHARRGHADSAATYMQRHWRTRAAGRGAVPTTPRSRSSRAAAWDELRFGERAARNEMRHKRVIEQGCVQERLADEAELQRQRQESERQLRFRSHEEMRQVEDAAVGLVQHQVRALQEQATSVNAQLKEIAAGVNLVYRGLGVSQWRSPSLRRKGSHNRLLAIGDAAGAGKLF